MKGQLFVDLTKLEKHNIRHNLFNCIQHRFKYTFLDILDMSRILYKSANEGSIKSEIITQGEFKEATSTTDDESEHMSLETNSEFTTKSD
jgi:hypothetical protein